MNSDLVPVILLAVRFELLFEDAAITVVRPQIFRQFLMLYCPLEFQPYWVTHLVANTLS